MNTPLKPAEGSILIDGPGDGVLGDDTRSLNEDGSAEVFRMRNKETAGNMAAVSQRSFRSFPFTDSDEPTLHLGIRHQFDLTELARGFVREMGLPVIPVTHDTVFAARYCDKIILVRDEEVVSAGTTKEIMTEENMRDIFRVITGIRYDERIGGLNVMMIGKYYKDQKEGII